MHLQCYVWQFRKQIFISFNFKLPGYSLFLSFSLQLLSIDDVRSIFLTSGVINRDGRGE